MFKIKKFKPLSANLTKWSNTQTIRGNLRTNYLSVFDHFIELALKGFTGLRLATPVTLPSFYDNLVLQPQIKLDKS